VTRPSEYPGPDNFDSHNGYHGRDVIRDFKVGVDKIEIDVSLRCGVTVSQYHSGWALVKIDVNGDFRTDAQILVHTDMDHVALERPVLRLRIRLL
jgi:hypothetical protein